MSTVYEIRRANLTRLTKERGAKQALAMKLDMTATQISHWLRTPGRIGARRIHEDHARKIEGALGLTPGSLDLAPGVKSKRLVDAELLALATRTVFEEARERGAADPRKLAGIVTLAYERAQQHGQLDREHIRTLLDLAQ